MTQQQKGTVPAELQETWSEIDRHLTAVRDLIAAHNAANPEARLHSIGLLGVHVEGQGGWTASGYVNCNSQFLADVVLPSVPALQELMMLRMLGGMLGIGDDLPEEEAVHA